MPWVAAVASLAFTAYSGAKQAQAQQEQADAALLGGTYNATLQANAAEQAALQGEENVRRTISAGQRFLKNQRAALAGSGVVGNTGSPLIALAYDAGQARLRALEQSQRVSAGYAAGSNQAVMTGFEGRQTATGYRRAATASLISTGGKLFSQGFGLYNSGALAPG